MIKISPVILGQLDFFNSDDHGIAHLRGWIFREDTAIDKVDISLGGQPWVSQISLYERPDVEQAFATVIDPCRHVLRSGFDVTAPLPMSVEADSKTIVAVTAYTPTGLPLDPLQTHLFPCASENNESQPPVDLQDRVGGSKDFVAIGGNVASLILTYIGKYKRIADAESILDWGCGCGRVITHMKKFVSPERLYGCDIDAAAIGWDKQNIAGPTFDRIEPYPPTNYSDGYFDIVYGISVMTHLEERTQLQWLKELRRICRPGAILALSVMGEKLRATNMPASLTKPFAEKGFASFVPNYSDMLTAFSHRDYYQEAYHALNYIESEWGRYFDVLEYVETKYQDIVILQAS
jgi:2-polyprenyl-3-methyl-5-hydroxy-6-metoxy-1,4-benzoquinol methylase